MKLKDLKNVLDQMTEDELDQPLIYNSDELSISGRVTGIIKAKEHLYYTGEDDPATLYTKQQLLDDFGYEEDYIDGFDIEIPKGRYYIIF